MNWITKKLLHLSERIKTVIKKRPSKDEIEKSDWVSCCAGPILKSELKENKFVCKLCGKHHRINCIDRFDLFFGKNSLNVLNVKAKDLKMKFLKLNLNKKVFLIYLTCL